MFFLQDSSKRCSNCEHDGNKNKRFKYSIRRSFASSYIALPRSLPSTRQKLSSKVFCRQLSGQVLSFQVASRETISHPVGAVHRAPPTRLSAAVSYIYIYAYVKQNRVIDMHIDTSTCRCFAAVAHPVNYRRPFYRKSLFPFRRRDSCIPCREVITHDLRRCASCSSSSHSCRQDEAWQMALMSAVRSQKHPESKI